MRQSYLQIFTKIIFFYSLFYVLMKLVAIFNGAWILTNLVFTLPYILFAAAGGYIMKSAKYNWLYVIIGVLIISIIRYFERKWMLQLHDYFL